MDIMLAYCGLSCDTCPIHLATLEPNISLRNKMRAEIAKQLSKIYGTVPKPENISDCDGCNVIDGRLFTGCVDCEVRKCARNKKLINCAYCSEFACDKLEKHYAFDPGSRVRLEEIHKNAHLKED